MPSSMAEISLISDEVSLLEYVWIVILVMIIVIFIIVAILPILKLCE